MDPKSTRDALEPAADICWGRDEHCSSIARIPADEGVAFLFGGPLTGKTTVLLRVYDTLSKQTTEVGKTSMMVVPVYLTPKALAPMDSRGFCKVLLQAILVACSKQIRGFTPPSIGRDGLNILDFATATDAQFQSLAEVRLQILCLLDDCKKLAEFHPDFVGNLQWLLCTRESPYRSRLSMAFTGGHEMRSMLVDKISAPRPAIAYLDALGQSEADSLVRYSLPARPPPAVLTKITTATFDAAGGHPGISRALLQAIIASGRTNPADLKEAVTEFEASKQGIFERIQSGLSPEARDLHDLLVSHSAVDLRQATAFLQKPGSPRPICHEIFRELRFNAIVIGDSSKIRPAGSVYWNYARQLTVGVTDEEPRARASQAELAGEATGNQVQGKDHPPSTEQNVFRQEDDGRWYVKYQGTAARFEDSKGFRIVHLLLSDPAVHYDVTELSRGPSLAQAINGEEIETGRGHHDSGQDDDAPDEVSQYESGYDEDRETERRPAISAGAMATPEAIASIRNKQNDLQKKVKALGQQINDRTKAPQKSVPRADPSLKELQSEFSEATEQLQKLDKWLEAAAPSGRVVSRNIDAGGNIKKINTLIEVARKRVYRNLQICMHQISQKLPALERHLWETKTIKGKRVRRGALKTGVQCRYAPSDPTPWLT